ncbi:MAG: hypothetical protein CM15mP18_3040 [Methanobacteriota archaeon]|nr:MAG: hypothetical protein CM15mP18_3040 [Euryarchaeota archaeon]
MGVLPERGGLAAHPTRNNAANRGGLNVPLVASWYGGRHALGPKPRSTAKRGGEKFPDEMLVFREHAYPHAHDVDRPYGGPTPPTGPEPPWQNPALVHPARPPGFWEGARATPCSGTRPHGVVRLASANNVRMTWGKGTAQWMEDPEARCGCPGPQTGTLGRANPNSIAGVMWCLGLFDPPFDPRVRMGTRSTSRPRDHAARLDPRAYREWTGAPCWLQTAQRRHRRRRAFGRFAALLRPIWAMGTVYDKGRQPAVASPPGPRDPLLIGCSQRGGGWGVGRAPRARL